MKKNKAFTLIELLAIIVILAIIAVITVPIILNIIENSKMGAATDSAYGYKDSVQKFYVSKLSESANSSLELEGTYTVTDGVLTGTGINEKIPVSGTIPSSGSLIYENGLFKNGCLTIGDYAVTFNTDGTTSTEKGICEEPAQDHTIATCPGCVFASYDMSKTKWIKGSGQGENEASGNNKLTDYYEDYSKLIEEKEKNYFLGHIIDDNNYIIKSYACGIENNKAFCLERTSDGSKYNSNVDTLNSVFPSCNADASASYSYCNGSDVDGDARSNGAVTVGSGLAACSAHNIGNSYCN